jgi:hypothetical protein
LPESLKGRCEAAAAAEGQSLNSWLIRAVTTALDPRGGWPFPGFPAGQRGGHRGGPFPPGFPFPPGPPGSRRIVGYGQARPLDPMEAHMSTFTVDGPLQADVTFGSGHLTIAAGNDGSATATVEALDPRDPKAVALAAEADIHLDGRTLTVHLRTRGWRSAGAAVHVRLHLPSYSDVAVAAGEVTVTAEGELGAVRVRAGSGTITIPSARDGVDVHSGDSTVVVGSAGSISIKSGKTRLRAGTVGDVTLRAGQASLELVTTTGTVRVKGAAVTMDVQEVGTGDVVFETATGRAVVGVKAGTKVQLDLSSSTGEVRCDLPLSDAPGEQAAALRLRLRSATGNICVSQASASGEAA